MSDPSSSPGTTLTERAVGLLPFVLAVVVDAWLWQAPSSPPPAPPVTRVVPFLLGQVLDGTWLVALAVLAHGAASRLVGAVVRASLGSSAAALLAGSVFALLPEPRAAVFTADLGILLAACFGLGSLVYGLRVRPLPWVSASLYLIALACHPLAIPVPFLLALAWARPPLAHLVALLASAIARSRSFVVDTVPGDEPWWWRTLGGATRGLGSALGVPEWTAVAILALALAAGASRGTLPLRVRVWCWFFVAASLPWSIIVLDDALPPPGAMTLAMLPVAALVAEIGIRVARRESKD